MRQICDVKLIFGLNRVRCALPSDVTKSRDRILFFAHTSRWVGPNNSLLLLLKYLRHRYDVAVLLPGKGLFSDALADEGIRFFSIPDATRRSILSISRLIRRE